MNTPATRSLAVCGWTPETSEALAALEKTGRFAATGIADASGAALIRARKETDLPCFQQVRQFLASAAYDAVLIASPQAAPVAALAAARGADLLVLAAACDADTIESAAEAARAHRVRLALIRPESHDAGIGDLLRLVGSSGEWDPHYVDVTVEGPTDTDRLLGAAVSHATRIAPGRHGLVRVSFWLGETSAPVRAVNATLEAGGQQVQVRARHAPTHYVRITGDAPAGAFELCISNGDASLAYSARSGERVQYRPESFDHWTVEAARASSADDTTQALEEAALRQAIARASLTGDVQANDCCARPELRLIEGLGQSEPRRHHLRLVVS